MNPLLRASALMRRVLLTLIFAFVLLNVPGCGGGTTGTGGTGSTEFSGKLLDEAGAPVSNAVVTIEETGDTAITDTEGNFTVETEVSTSTVTVHVQSDSTDAKTTIDQIPADPKSIAVTLQLNRRKNILEVKRRDVIQRPTRTPKQPQNEPTRTPKPGEPGTPVPTTAASPTVASPTVAPPRVSFTTFIGTVVSSEQRIVTRSRIGVSGKQLSFVGRDGDFTFRVGAGAENSVLDVRSGELRTSVSLSGVTASTERVQLQIRIEKVSNTEISAVVESISTAP